MFATFTIFLSISEVLESAITFWMHLSIKVHIGGLYFPKVALNSMPYFAFMSTLLPVYGDFWLNCSWFLMKAHGLPYLCTLYTYKNCWASISVILFYI